MTGRTTTAMVWWTWRSLYVSARTGIMMGMTRANRIWIVMTAILRLIPGWRRYAGTGLMRIVTGLMIAVKNWRI